MTTITKIGQAKQAAKESEAVNRNIDDAIASLLNVENGRDFLWWLLQIGKVNTQPFQGNALHTSFNCGRLDVGNQILARIIEVNSAGYVRMLQEKEDERKRAGAGTDGADGTDDGGDDFPANE